MIGLNSLEKYVASTPAIERLKIWSELAVELLLAGMLTIGLISWTNSIVEAGGLVCVPLYGDTYAYDISAQRYSSSRCQFQQGPRMLLFYPYFLLFTFGVIFICHVTWTRLPSVISKLTTYYLIFSQTSQLVPTFMPNNKDGRLLPQFEYNDENLVQARTIHEKILFLLLDNSYVAKIYNTKTRVTAVATFLGMIGNVVWIWLSNFGKTTFSCQISIENSEKVLPTFTCDVSSHAYISGVMILQQGLLLLVFLVESYCTYWGSIFKKNIDIFSIDETFAHFQNLPGIEDFIFCISIIKSNLRDGNFTMEAIKYVLNKKLYQNKAEIKSNSFDFGFFNFNSDDDSSSNDCGNLFNHAVNETQADNHNNKVSNRKELRLMHRKVQNLAKNKFDEEYKIIEYLLNMLGLNKLDNEYKPAHLYDIFDGLFDEIAGFDFCRFKNTMRKKIYREVKSRPCYYKLLCDLLFKHEIVSSKRLPPPTTTTAVFKMSDVKNNKTHRNGHHHHNEMKLYSRVLRNIKKHAEFGNQVCVAAAAEILGIKIILIQAGKSHQHGAGGNHHRKTPNIIDVFEPYTNKKVRNIVFLTFMSPFYYNLAVIDPETQDEVDIILTRDRFISQVEERQRLRQQAVKLVARTKKTDFFKDGGNMDKGNNGDDYAYRENGAGGHKEYMRKKRQIIASSRDELHNNDEDSYAEKGNKKTRAAFKMLKQQVNNKFNRMKQRQQLVENLSSIVDFTDEEDEDFQQIVDEAAENRAEAERERENEMVGQVESERNAPSETVVDLESVRSLTSHKNSRNV